MDGSTKERTGLIQPLGDARRIAREGRMARREALAGNARPIAAVYQDPRGLTAPFAGEIGIVAYDSDGLTRIGFLEKGETRSCLALDQSLMDVMGLIAHERFYVFPGDETQLACHVSTMDLVAFVRDIRPDLTYRPRTMDLAA